MELQEQSQRRFTSLVQTKFVLDKQNKRHVYILNNSQIDDKNANKLFQEIIHNQEKHKEETQVDLILLLNENSIGKNGCQALLNAKLTQVYSLNLDQNEIQSKGCWYLTKAIWHNLHELSLSTLLDRQIQQTLDRKDAATSGKLPGRPSPNSSQVCDSCCSKQQHCWFWHPLPQKRRMEPSEVPHPQQLANKRGDNFISDKGCEHLVQGQWALLQILGLSKNVITDQGCKYLSTGNWPSLQSLDLQQNHLGNKGLFHLKKGQWKHLDELIISQNQIGQSGCRSLVKGDWKNLSFIELARNTFENKGCVELTKSQWKQEKILNSGMGMRHRYGRNILRDTCSHRPQ